MGSWPKHLPALALPDLAAGWIDLLDQSQLPESVEYVRLTTAEGAADAIQSLKVRGAPAIGIVGGLGLALGVGKALVEGGLSSRGRAEEEMERLRALLYASRPTGRNLGWALSRVAEAFRIGLRDSTEEAVGQARAMSLEVWKEEEARCDGIGEVGLEVIPEVKASILTHCNAGALATGGIGTATAPLYVAAREGVRLRVFAGETRPVMQGARLTAWELDRAGLDVTVVADSMAGSLMARGDVDLVIVGADAVTTDGSVVNKIGTYPLAVLAMHHGLPFYVALPTTTIDPSRGSSEIPIESRAEEELRQFGERCTVPPGANVWNPAFDLTPPELVTAFLTETELVRPPFDPRLSALAPQPPVG